VTGRTEGSLPAFEQVRADLVRDFNRQRSEAATERLYRSLLEEYEVAIDEQALAGATLEATRTPAR
jgi:parvulin-like peptidyl-prolyl isomerase